MPSCEEPKPNNPQHGFQTMVPSPEVSLGALRRGEADAVKTATRCLQEEGFVFLEMTTTTYEDELLQQCQEPLQEAAKFLQGPARGKGSRDATVLHGHISHRYKDSLRLLSGNQFNSKQCPSEELAQSLKRLARTMDDTARDMTQALAQPLFGLSSASRVGAVFDLPLLQDDAPVAADNDDTAERDSSYGLLDLVCYHNDAVAPKIVVSAHQDPGLLILALPETAPGLQLLSRDDKTWMSPPPNRGVLWAGKAARGYAQPCQHRVVTHVGTPRVACWHEICTRGQICQPLLDRLKAQGEELEYRAIGNHGAGTGSDSTTSSARTIQGTRAVLEHLRQAENHEYPPLPTKPQETGALRLPWLRYALAGSSLHGMVLPRERLAGIAVPDTARLVRSHCTADISDDVPALTATSKESIDANALREKQSPVFDNNGLGYTLTVETLNPKAGVPGPKVAEEVTIRVTVRKNKTMMQSLLWHVRMFLGFLFQVGRNKLKQA